ncbi:hypothetical protein FG386_000039 [Cryptosporidium ryanae]|uniref:uncharacterized protein n=1 Tax=Cryptosporidium ryanae TaxID=515981 RepID=UPI00351A98D0|nr:hypothetical protein FG386_000039 [Cryptosporidium ryanae]
MNPMAKISLLENDMGVEDLCEKLIGNNEISGIVISLDEEVDIYTAVKISKKYSSDKLFCSYSISLGTRFFLFYDNKYIKLSEILDTDNKSFKEKLIKIKNLHPYIFVILVILREKFSSNANETKTELLEISKEIRFSPKLTCEELTNVYNYFNEFWGTTISPISSIAGGLLCQEVTKSCTQETSDYCCCVFDMDSCEAVTAIIK